MFVVLRSLVWRVGLRFSGLKCCRYRGRGVENLNVLGSVVWRVGYLDSDLEFWRHRGRGVEGFEVLGFKQRCQPRQKSRVERLKAKMEPLFT